MRAGHLGCYADAPSVGRVRTVDPPQALARTLPCSNRALAATGHHVLAQLDDDSVCVYQAFRPDIAAEAVRLQRFEPSFSLGRMSWIKPNFLWMMFRCGWATKVDQERVLAVRLQRSFFETLLRSAVASSYEPAALPSREAWQEALRSSEVRLQWDPDHGPSGAALTRRAIQLGLRGATLETYASSAIVATEAGCGLARESVDRILVVHVWHHLPDRGAFTRDLAAALRPRGRLFVVDFAVDAERGPPTSMRMAPEAIIAEIEAAGLTASVSAVAVPDQYIVEARRVP